MSKVEVPQSIAGTGAKIAKFSPDGKWLLLISPNSDVQMYRVAKAETSKIEPFIHPQAIHLKRLQRDHIKTRTQCGSLGRYMRSVSRVAFSANSRILTVGDICGYLDSWVLEEHEDLTTGGDEADDASNSSGSSDNGTADESSQCGGILGHRWIRNSAASLIPQLPAAPLILSFRPLKRRAASDMPDGNTAICHTPYPRSHHVPTGEDRLFVLTCDHQMYEFSILSGKLSDWSRRNPTTSLPSEFRKIQECAKGSIWDMNQAKERIWIYGSSWLWMFDLSQDFPVKGEAGNVPLSNDDVAKKRDGARSLKRKRRTVDPQEVQQGGRQSTGAGGRPLDSELSIGIGRKFRKTNGPDIGQGQWISAEKDQPLALDHDGDQADHDSSLISLRRDSHRRARTGRNSIEDLQTSNGGARENTDDMQAVGSHSPVGLPYWGTHKYRDILGIVPLGTGDEEREEGFGPRSGDGALPGGVEVALVERPLWEVDLPPKFYGNQEWDR